MGTYPPPGSGPGGVGRRIEEVIDRVEMELRGAVGYINDAIVPQIRRESISTMRSLADLLRGLADRFEQSARPQPPPPQPPAPPEEPRP